VEEQRAVVVPRFRLREEAIGYTQGLDVEYKPEKQVVVEWLMKPREVLQDVVVSKLLPITVTDCEGHCHTEFQSCPVVEQRKVTVFESVPEQREVVIQVPHLKPGVPLEIRHLVLDTEMRAAIESRMKLHVVPNDVNLTIPCPAPIAPPH
jgi:hypothetical protein